MKDKLNKIREALEINTRKTAFIVRDYRDDKEAKRGVELGKEALTLLDEVITELDSEELVEMIHEPFQEFNGWGVPWPVNTPRLKELPNEQKTKILTQAAINTIKGNKE